MTITHREAISVFSVFCGLELPTDTPLGGEKEKASAAFSLCEWSVPSHGDSRVCPFLTGSHDEDESCSPEERRVHASQSANTAERLCCTGTVYEMQRILGATYIQY